MSEGMIPVQVDGKGQVDVAQGATFKDVAAAAGLTADPILAVASDDRTLDLTVPVSGPCRVKFLTFDDEPGLEVFRHSSAHILAQAVMRLFPDARPTIGPVVEEGFYYDFDAKPFNPEDLETIEEEMRTIVRENLDVTREVLDREEALDLFSDNPYKVEMIEELSGDITAYRQGNFVDLCRGPHVPKTGFIKSFKLTKVAGAYWRGDQRNKQLQRIYGVSFPDDKSLADHLQRLEEARERDHRRIGTEMDLFSFHDEGQGFPFWHPKGMALRNEVVEYWNEVHHRYGYVQIQTPAVLDQVLWFRSGHYDHYRNNMYFTDIDDTPHAIKPMNCPGGLLVYKSRLHSYREFPLKVAELGLVHRHELSGVLHGLFRVRAFTQDDAHVFCTPEMVPGEVAEVIGLVFEIYRTFGFDDVKVELSTQPEEGSIGTNETWEVSEQMLKDALAKRKVPYELNPGDGAFYGPKIDFHIKDCMGRSWQCGTIQVDFSMPDRFSAVYEDKDGKRKTPVMIHRAILGSLERFIGILIEHYAGKFPLFLSPEQVRILPVADAVNDYAQRVTTVLTDAGIRAEADLRSEKLGKKIRDAQLAHVNYQVVVGGKEEKAGTVSVRTRSNENLPPMSVDHFVDKLKTEIERKVL